MKSAQTDWLTEGPLDFEYHQYRLLAYLQHVRRNFGQRKLYPDLSELQRRYRHSRELQAARQALSDRFPRHLTGLDPAARTLTYRPVYSESPAIETLTDVLAYAVPQLQRAVTEGESLYDEIQAHVVVHPIGIMPLQRQAGYLFVYDAAPRRVHVYEYQLLFYSDDTPPRRQLRTTPVEVVGKNLSTTFEHLKLDLIRRRRHLPNPASYLIESRWPYPLEETLLPVARRKVARAIEEAA
jgi:hypothetical protein